MSLQLYTAPLISLLHVCQSVLNNSTQIVLYCTQNHSTTLSTAIIAVLRVVLWFCIQNPAEHASFDWLRYIMLSAVCVFCIISAHAQEGHCYIMISFNCRYPWVVQDIMNLILVTLAIRGRVASPVLHAVTHLHLVWSPLNPTSVPDAL